VSNRSIIVGLGLLIAVAFAFVVATTIDGEELRFTVAVAGALALSVATLAALDKFDNDPPYAH